MWHRSFAVAVAVAVVVPATSCVETMSSTTSDTATTGTSGTSGTTTGTSGTTSGTTTDTTSATSGSATDTATGTSTRGTTTAADPEVYCAMFETADACNAAAANENMPCAWRSFIVSQREGDVCTNMPPYEACVAEMGNTSDPGCGLTPGCTAFVPFYRVLADQTVALVNQCGGAAPVGFSACWSGSAADADPPECACLCELLP